MLLEGTNLTDALYMTVISITTVGFSEVIPLSPAGKYFTILLIFGGVGFFLYMVSLITEAMMEGGLYTFLGRRLMEKKMGVMKDHFIVCGFGRIGKVISKILYENNRPFLIIENNPEEIQAIDELGYLVLQGDSTNDDMLTKVDRTSMAVGLEARVPLLATELVSFAFSLPESIRYHNDVLKGLLKYSFRNSIDFNFIAKRNHLNLLSQSVNHRFEKELDNYSV